jgi:hypothetical protein
MLKIVAGAFLFISSLAARANDSCSKANFHNFIVSSQTSALDLEQKALSFSACPSDDLKEAVAQWVIISNRLSSKDDKGPAVTKLTASYKKPVGDIERVIWEARQGNYKQLFEKLDLNTYEYVQMKQAHLALARSLFRAEKYTDALRYYNSYLKLAMGDEYVEAEYLYALVVSESSEYARIYMNQLSGFRDSAFMKTSVKNAKALLDAKQPVAASASTQALFDLDKTANIQFNLSHFGNKEVFARSSGALSYSNKFSITVAHHQLDADIFNDRYQGTELKLAYADRYDEMLDYDIGLSYFSPTGNHLLYRLGGSYKLPYDLKLGLTLTETPFALAYPVPKSETDIVTAEYSLMLSWLNMVHMKSSLFKESGYTYWERHTLSLEKNDIMINDFDMMLSVHFPLEIEKHSKPHPSYHSFPTASSIGAAAELKQRIRSTVGLKIGGLFKLINGNYYGSKTKYTSGTLVEAGCEFIQVSNPLRYSLGGTYRQTNFQDNEIKAEYQTLIELKAAYLL